MPSNRLRFGAFIAPFHPLDENPTLAIERDLELVEWMDQLGYDEAWIGEHHSAGYEIIASPEVFIAAAAERTRHIRLGTGVSSLPYHHPLMLADRINQLDHMTRGRVMFGVGPGALPSDALMMGIQPVKQRDMMDEALDVIVRAAARRDGHPQDRLVQAERRPAADDARSRRPHIEIAVASQVSPTGAHGRRPAWRRPAVDRRAPRPAASTRWRRTGRSPRTGAPSTARRSIATPGAWSDRCTSPRRASRRARTCSFGLEKWMYYFTDVAALPIAPQGGGDPVDALIETGLAVIGTPDDAIAQIERLETQSGGFGCFLQMAHDWADWAETKHSYELFARHVAPKFQALNGNREDSYKVVGASHDATMGQARMAVGQRIVQHIQEKGTENVAPQILEALGLNKKPDAAE